MSVTVNGNPYDESADGQIYGQYPTGDAPVGGGDLTYTISDHPTTVIWFDPNWGGPFNGTEAEPYDDIRDALSDTTNGQGATIKWKDGTYAVDSSNYLKMMVNDRTLDGFSTINSGAGWASSNTNRDNMITIMAENPYGVRLNYTGSSSYYRSFVYLENADYISVDGFIFDYDATAGAAVLDGASFVDNCYMTRCIVKTDACGQAGSWVRCGDNSLVEMCAGVGATRYGFRSGDSTAATNNHCFRMCVGRFDTGEFTVPSATFAHYGNNSGNTSRDAAFLNCIALDGQWYDTGNGNLIKWGGFYLPKNATDIIIKGQVILNEEVNYAGIFAGEQQGENIDISDSIAWDIVGSTIADGYRNNAGGTGNSANALTVGNVEQNFYYVNNTLTPTNDRASDTLNGTDKTILYQSDGGDARYLFGSLGQRYGDAGFDTKSSTEIFPWPYEDEIKAVFTEQIDTAVDHFPAGNVSNRGFCLDTSLTNYLITYVDGTATIGDLY